MEGKTNALIDFECLGCGACCRENGYVRLEGTDADKIAQFLGLDVFDFIQTYTRLTRDRRALSLKDGDSGACIFLTSCGCRIHPAKPRQCRHFPVKWRFKAFDTTCAWAISQSKP